MTDQITRALCGAAGGALCAALAWVWTQRLLAQRGHELSLTMTQKYFLGAGIIALAAALVAALALYQLLKEISKPQETPRTDVVVAAVDIPENTEITADMVMLSPVATEALLPNVMKDPESVIGMVLSSDVYAGEQIVSERLVRMGETESRSNTLSNIMQAQSAAIRRSRRSKVQEKAAKVSTKILLPMVTFIFPVLFVVLLGPSVITIMEELG